MVVANDTQPLPERLKADLIRAIKAGNQARKDVLRFVLTTLGNERIRRGAELTDDQAISVVSTVQKQLGEAADVYRQSGDQLRADAEAAQASLLAEYLPTPLVEAELTALVTEAIRTTGATSVSQLGRVIALVKGRAGPRADGATIAALVRARLT